MVGQSGGNLPVQSKKESPRRAALERETGSLPCVPTGGIGLLTIFVCLSGSIKSSGGAGPQSAGRTDVAVSCSDRQSTPSRRAEKATSRSLGACPRISGGRVPGGAGGRCKEGRRRRCRCKSSGSANAADAPAPPEPKGIWVREARCCIPAIVPSYPPGLPHRGLGAHAGTGAPISRRFPARTLPVLYDPHRAGMDGATGKNSRILGAVLCYYDGKNRVSTREWVSA